MYARAATSSADPVCGIWDPSLTLSSKAASRTRLRSPPSSTGSARSGTQAISPTLFMRTRFEAKSRSAVSSQLRTSTRHSSRCSTPPSSSSSRE